MHHANVQGYTIADAIGPAMVRTLSTKVHDTNLYPTAPLSRSLSKTETEELARIAALLDHASVYLDKASLRLSALPSSHIAPLRAINQALESLVYTIDKEVKWNKDSPSLPKA